MNKLMNKPMNRTIDRRTLLKTFTLIGAFGLTEVSLGNTLPRTRRDAEGPYYPVEPIPLDATLMLSEKFIGDELEFSGTVRDVGGEPLEQILVEIWQCDGTSIYNHPSAPSTAQRDPSFRGYGASLTDQLGAFTFRTIVPVAYPGRPPHIHAKLWKNERELLTTQIYLEGQRGASDRKIKPESETRTKGTDDRAGERDRYLADFDFVV